MIQLIHFYNADVSLQHQYRQQIHWIYPTPTDLMSTLFCGIPTIFPNSFKVMTEVNQNMTIVLFDNHVEGIFTITLPKGPHAVTATSPVSNRTMKLQSCYTCFIMTLSPTTTALISSYIFRFIVTSYVHYIHFSQEPACGSNINVVIITITNSSAHASIQISGMTI